MWRWSVLGVFIWRAFALFPTVVGVIPQHENQKQSHHPVPHGCGGDPIGKTTLVRKLALFPTGVGVIPFHCVYSWGESTIPHVRGGDPAGFYHDWTCSPRMWGWSRQRPSHKWESPMFLTCVGVILTCTDILQPQVSVPHGCGGDPYTYRGRFFLFPA